MNRVDNYRLNLGSAQYAPIVVGGMGVDISTSELVLETVRLGGIGHLSDAMVPAVCDRLFGTKYVANKVKRFQEQQATSFDEARIPLYDPHELRLAQMQYIEHTVAKKQGSGGIFVNCMEKVLMGAPSETLAVRLIGALDAGVDGISLSAGLHNHSLRMIEHHPRFRDAKIGILVSSWRALKIFLRTAQRVNRMPDYIVVEGPLAGGHLGFGFDWAEFNLETIFLEVLQNLEAEGLKIPVIAAGGLFDSQDALHYLERGAAAVQVATRFSIAKESGLSAETKQAYINAKEEDVLVAGISPTGYLMRLLRESPCLGSNISPRCLPLGFALDSKGRCPYPGEYLATGTNSAGEKLPVLEKVCLCQHMIRYDCHTCGQNVIRLKEKVKQGADGAYILPSTEEIFNDYMGK